MSYSLENAQNFNWSSVSGNLNSERVSHLETYLVGNKILDAGCGGGAFVEFLSQKGLEVTGVDKYDQFLQVARERSRTGTYVEGDILNLPFPSKTFDCTYCFDVLEHVDDRLAIQELIRVTINRVIIAVPKQDELLNKFSLTFFHYQDKTHLRNYTEASLKELIAAVKFSNLIVFPELPVQLKSLVQEMIEFKIEQLAETEMKLCLLKCLVKNLVKFKKFNFKDSQQEASKILLKNLIDKASYKQVHTGLVAIIDL